MAVAKPDDLTAGTIDGLEIRLKRLESLITGRSFSDVAASASRNGPVAARLKTLEASLEDLSSKSPAVREFLSLYKAHPDLFPPPGALPSSNSFTPREQLATINASATAFSTTASQLTSVQDSPIPSAELSASLVALQPRLAAAEQKRLDQNRQLAELRLRSARVLERWYDLSIMGGNECWAEWDQRLTQVERALRQEEMRRQKDEEPI